MKQSRLSFFSITRKVNPLTGLIFIFFLASPLFLNAQKNNDTCRVSNVTLGVGVFDASFGPSSQGLVEVNYFAKKQFWIFSPFGGFIVTTKASYYLYGGLVIPFHLARSLYLNISFAPGLWAVQDGIDLGYPLEFRVGVEFAYTFKDKSRMGVEFMHVSNANISSMNPGVENLSLFYSIPLKARKK
jgi:hypothetical protein